MVSAISESAELPCLLRQRQRANGHLARVVGKAFWFWLGLHLMALHASVTHTFGGEERALQCVPSSVRHMVMACSDLHGHRKALPNKIGSSKNV